MGKGYSKEDNECLRKYQPVIKKACQDSDTFESNLNIVLTALDEGDPYD